VYLSDRDLQWAIQTGRLIIEPKPQAIDPTSIDLHLDSVEEARIWDIQSYQTHNEDAGRDGPTELRIAKVNYKAVAKRYQIPPPEDSSAPVFRRGREIVAKPNSFFLWQTREEVGTPVHGADLIAFVDGKRSAAAQGNRRRRQAS
jgi:deoxycytidine triphosphate deaminase